MSNSVKPQLNEITRLHTRCVYKDPDFIKKVEILKKSIPREHDNHIYGGKEQGELKLLIGDEDIRKIPQWFAKEIECLEDDFGIDFELVLGYINSEGPPYNSDVSFSHRSIFDNKTAPFLSINIGPNATKQDVINSLKHFDKTMQRAYGDSRVKRKKLPENYDLVYAIYRARKKGMKFKDIFELYKSKNLPLYGGPSQLNSVEMLKKYYYKYKKVTT